MGRTLPAAAFAAALLAFAGAASATEVNIRITTSDRGYSGVGYYDRDKDQPPEGDA